MKKRFWDLVSQGVLALTILVLASGFVRAQMSQDYTNATTQERLNAIAFRVDKLEHQSDELNARLTYGLIGLVGNLLAHMIQIQEARKRRQ